MVKRVGITGAAGHIGAALVEGLRDKYILTLFDWREMREPEDGSRFVRVDLSQREQISGMFEGLDAVVHLAADASPQATWESVLANNIVATYNVY
jgi:nucleoside-diphosphate-sugar epimerase